MERRISSRAQVDVRICALVDGFRHACRASELSPTGMVFERSRGLAGHEITSAAPFEIYLPGVKPIRARVRPVWASERIQAVKFVMINDADRLTIAELLDGKVRMGGVLH
jgi:hypothetical protein